MVRRLAVFLLFISMGFLAGLVLTGRMETADEARAVPAPQAPDAGPAPPQGRAALAALPDLTGIAERAVNAVTSITSTQTIRAPLSDDPFYRFFYGDRMVERQAQSLGSGVIVSADGYVVTNNHVIGDPRAQVAVILADKRELPARIVGMDAQTDLAVLKVDAANLPTIGWGDSSRLRVAEWVLAIGNPFGVFSQTVTLGIVSATGRSVEGLDSYEEFIQTDAAINRGNSGGALINGRGELVGINTAIYSETGGYQGIGLAVPSNLVRKTIDELVKSGVVRRGWIDGVSYMTLSPRVAEQLGAPDTRGLLIQRVARGSDAAAAGLLPGDVLVAFNGTTIESVPHYLRMLSEAEVGSTVDVGIIREGRRATARVRISQAPPMRQRR